MRDSCDLNRRSASAVAGPDCKIIGTDTLNELQWGKHDQPLLSFSRELSVLRAPLPRYVSLYNFILFYIYSQHACANIRFGKTHRHPPCPPPRKRTGGASSPFSGEKNREVGGISESGRWIRWERKKIGARPSSFPPSDPSAIPMSTATTAPPQRKQGRYCEER